MRLLPIALLPLALACEKKPPPAEGSAPAASIGSSGPRASAASPDKCLQSARACGEALIAGEHERFVDTCMAEELLTATGARAAILRELVKGTAEMAKDGVTFDHAEYDPPTSMAAAGGTYFCAIPQRVFMKVPQGHLRSRGFLVGVSKDGAAWKFVDGVASKDGKLKRVFPNLPADLVLPPLVDEPDLLP